jgi:hypothetical protein
LARRLYDPARTVSQIQPSPENTSLYNSDGVLFCSTGALAPGVTVDKATYFKRFFLPTERLWVNSELFRVDRAPYSGAFTPYTAGMTGWVPMVQTVLAF